MIQIKTEYELAIELAELKYQLERGKKKKSTTRQSRNKSFKELTLAEKKVEGYKKRATKKAIEFALTVSQVDNLLQSSCVYCGDPSDCLDRIDSKKGYTIDNVQPSCNTCNMMKYTHATDEFINHIQKILDYYKR